MARIRSIHPGIYSDEAWASISIAARWLGVALCTEADDNGVFEWKPLQIKMRVFPGDNMDVAPLLDELQGAEIITHYEAEGRTYGAIKNFCRYQKPRKPQTKHPLPDAMAAFVALQYRSVTQKSEPDDNEAPPVPSETEKPFQRDDGGGKRKEEETSLRSVAAREIVSDRTAELDQLETELREAAGLENDPSPALLDLSPMTALLAKGYTLTNDILPKLREAKARGKRGGTWKYYLAGITETKASNDGIKPKPSTTPSAPVTWINEDDPRFKPLAERHQREHGKPIRTSGSRYENGIGAHFPADWAPAKTSVAA